MYLHTDRWVRNHRHLYHSGWTFLFQLSPAFLNNLYIFAIGIAVILAIGMIIWGGTEIALNRGSVSSVMDGKGKISQALLGLLLVLSPALVFSIITPAILNLEVNMPKLETTWGNFTGAGGGTGTAGSCPTWIDWLAGLCVSATWTACGGATDCSSVIKSCPSDLTHRRDCVTPRGENYTPGTNGAPKDSCNPGDAATCSTLRTWF